MARMKSDFVYPDIADRGSVEEWEKNGSPNIHEMAKKENDGHSFISFPLPDIERHRQRDQGTVSNSIV